MKCPYCNQPYRNLAGHIRHCVATGHITKLDLVGCEWTDQELLDRLELAVSLPMDVIAELRRLARHRSAISNDIHRICLRHERHLYDE